MTLPLLVASCLLGAAAWLGRTSLAAEGPPLSVRVDGDAVWRGDAGRHDAARREALRLEAARAAGHAPWPPAHLPSLDPPAVADEGFFVRRVPGGELATAWLRLPGAAGGFEVHAWRDAHARLVPSPAEAAAARGVLAWSPASLTPAPDDAPLGVHCTRADGTSLLVGLAPVPGVPDLTPALSCRAAQFLWGPPGAGRLLLVGPPPPGAAARSVLLLRPPALVGRP